MYRTAPREHEAFPWRESDNHSLCPIKSRSIAGGAAEKFKFNSALLLAANPFDTATLSDLLLPHLISICECAVPPVTQPSKRAWQGKGGTPVYY
jgi:hypothetical protein